jgi:6-phosphofructokinase 1
MLSQADLEIPTLGPNTIPSPLHLSTRPDDGLGDFVSGKSRVRYQISTSPDAPYQDLAFEQAGPRERVYFEPSETTAAVVTCGGLCPGLNNVIRSITMELRHNYGVRRVLGIRHGYLGLNPESGFDPIDLNTESVSHIHEQGGSMLGSSRGAQDPEVVVDFLHRRRIDILFCVGGDGTQRGAHCIHEVIKRRDLKISVVGIPKTIDNDIKFVFRTFGFATALEIAQNALACAHVEAKGYPLGVGVVKLMGRDAGFIAAGATLASQEVNFCLVPEAKFELEGPQGLLPALKNRLLKRNHAVVAVAEGAGQHLCGGNGEKDDSGNPRYNDIGLFIKDKIC